MGRTKYTVGIYVTSSEYGGPEEGGWWYDTGVPVLEEYTRTFYRYDSAVTYRDHLTQNVLAELNDPRLVRHAHPSGGCGDDTDCVRGQRADGEEYVAVIDTGTRAPYPEKTPRYE